MILSFSATQALRVKLATVAVGAVALTTGHALAKNHDLQAFRLPSISLALHDRAPGPCLRAPN